MTIRPTGLAEAALFVGDLGRASRFYGEVLGLEQVLASPRGCVFLVRDEEALVILPEGSAGTPSDTPGGTIPAVAPGSGTGPGKSHIALRVRTADVSAWRARLEAHGVDVESEVSWSHGGSSLYFRDPDGHLIELVTPGLWRRPAADGG